MPFFVEEDIMRYICDNDLHIHSKLSLCSGDKEQNCERILKYAEDNGISTLCLTDHYWDNTIGDTTEFYRIQDFDHISRAKPLPQSDKVRFLFGCETEMDKNMRIGIPKERFDDFDFVIIPTTHFHMTGFTIDENLASPEQRANFWLKKLNTLLDMELPFRKIGIAHLTCVLIYNSSREKFLKTIDSLPTAELESVFKRAADVGVGIELNGSDMQFKENEQETVLRPYRTAKEAGCKFYLGSDAHHPSELDPTIPYFERAIDLLELTENDKFKI